MATGEKDLAKLLATLKPTLDPIVYIFATTTQPLTSLPLSTLRPQMLFCEAEGTTIITTEELARAHGYQDSIIFRCRKISLTVHSSLEAVGLTAAIAVKFKACGVSSNVVSAYFHDHIFVPVGTEEVALKALRELSEESERASA